MPEGLVALSAALKLCGWVSTLAVSPYAFITPDGSLMIAYRKPLLLCSLVLIAGCTDVQTTVYQEGLVTESGEPAYITIQHCLIGVRDGMPQRAIRNQEEAAEFAAEILERAKAGEDFAGLVRQYTDDSAPGIYKLANHGYESDAGGQIPSRAISARGSMVPGFGDVGFKLEVGEIGMASYDSTTSRFGYHIIKRIK